MWNKEPFLALGFTSMSGAEGSGKSWNIPVKMKSTLKIRTLYQINFIGFFTVEKQYLEI